MKAKTCLWKSSNQEMKKEELGLGYPVPNSNAPVDLGIQRQRLVASQGR